MGSMPRVDGVTVRRLLCPLRLFVRALALRLTTFLARRRLPSSATQLAVRL